MKQETQKLLSLGLQLPPEERTRLAQELLRSAPGKAAPAGEVAEMSSAYGEFASAPSSTVLGSYPSRNLREAFGTFGDEIDLAEVDLAEVLSEVRRRSQERMVGLAVAQAEAALAQRKGAPRVVKLEVEPGLDPFGNARANVSVVLARLARGRLYAWDKLQPIHDIIWEAFNEKATGGPWPYIKFHQESEPFVDDEVEAKAV